MSVFVGAAEGRKADRLSVLEGCMMSHAIFFVKWRGSFGIVSYTGHAADCKDFRC